MSRTHDGLAGRLFLFRLFICKYLNDLGSVAFHYCACIILVCMLEKQQRSVFTIRNCIDCSELCDRSSFDGYFL